MPNQGHSPVPPQVRPPMAAAVLGRLVSWLLDLGVGGWKVDRNEVW